MSAAITANTADEVSSAKQPDNTVSAWPPPFILGVSNLWDWMPSVSPTPSDFQGTPA